MSQSLDKQNITPVIKCESVYKIFGNNALKTLQNSKDKLMQKLFQEAGCIVGVNNATFGVKRRNDGCHGFIRIRKINLT